MTSQTLETGKSAQTGLNTQSARRSEEMFERAKRVFPGGIARATVARAPHPIYIDHGEGAWLIDLDENRYLDFNNNFTTLIHGHGFEPVATAITHQLQSGSCFANPTTSEIDLATVLCERVPCIDKIRFVNTGTEAVMFALKAARAYTGRTKIAKFEGAYHGSYDWAEVSEASSSDNWGDDEPASVRNYKGMPQSVLNETVVLPFNDLEATRRILEKHASDLACVLIDVMPSRAGLIPASPTYLAMLREITRDHGVILICDEVLNFRQHFNGAAARFDVEPDLVTLGKIIGGGLPIGAIGGRDKFMSVFSSEFGRAPVAQGGTFSANPLSMAAGVASMQALDKEAFESLEQRGEAIRQGLSDIAGRYGLPVTITGQASLFRIHPKTKAPNTYRAAYPNLSEARLLTQICDALLRHGVNLPSNGTGCLSTAMKENEIDHLVAAFEKVAKEISP